MAMVWLPMVSDDASRASRAPVVEHALSRAEVVPVTETLASTVGRGVIVVLARAPVETKIDAAPLGVNTKPSTTPPPV